MTDNTSPTMTDNTSIIVAAIALVSGIGAAAVVGWTTFYSAKSTRLDETEVLIAKYRDPLVFAALDLQSRLYSIVIGGYPLSWRGDADDRKEKNLYRYTTFLVGRYLSWTYIFRRQAQFLHMRTHKDSKLTKTMDLIEFTFSYTMEERGSPFCLWRGEQMAIGELMTRKEEDGEQFCLGYAEFHSKLDNTNDDFKSWFDSLEADIDKLADAWMASRQLPDLPDQRLRQLQHLLIDLITILDPHKLQSTRRNKCKQATVCPCSTCESQPSQQAIAIDLQERYRDLEMQAYDDIGRQMQRSEMTRQLAAQRAAQAGLSF